MKSFIALSFIVIFSASFANEATDQGMTTEILRSAQKAYCIGEELATQQPPSLRWTMEDGRKTLLPYLDWNLVDSLRIIGDIGPNQRLAFSFDPLADTLETYFYLDSLPTICQQAIAYAPTWIKEELTSAFQHLGDSAQFYAQLLLNAPSNFVDEIAFCIAKIGPEVLMHPLFNPDLLLENVSWLYQIDDSIQYANIIDYGSPPGNYYSTISYCVLDNEDTIWQEYPRDIYYYYIVHPTTSDELPRLDDYVYNKHWREYLFFYADSGYPVLGDYIKRARIVWKRQREILQPNRPFLPTDHALDIIGNWATRTVPVMASGNRPIHPNVIAHEHNGNCGELQDLITAACRTCLIPCVNTMDPCEDHVWSEFFDRSFYPYQVCRGCGPTQIADTSVAYDEQYGGSKRVSAIWNWRPDGFFWDVTGKYSHSCSLYVEVYDQLGRPIDGARVLIYSEYYYGGLTVTAIGFTDRLGSIGFELGDLRNFYARITTPFGSYPADPNATVKIINVSQSNARYYKSFYLYKPMPAPRPRLEIFSGDSVLVHRLSLDMNMPKRLEYGYSISRGAGWGDPDDSVRFYQFYANKQDSGKIDCYITNTAGYNNYLNQVRFGALFLGNDIPPFSLDFICPDTAKYYAIISNEDRTYSANCFDLNLKLYSQTRALIAQGNQISPNYEWRSATLIKGRIRIQLNRMDNHSPPDFQLFQPTGSKITEGFRLEARRENEMVYNIQALPAGIYFLQSASRNRQKTVKIAIVR